MHARACLKRTDCNLSSHSRIRRMNATVKRFSQATRRGIVRRRLLTVMMLAAAVLGISGRQSFSQTVSRVELHAVQTTTPPKLDGVLDEAVWTSEPVMLEGWASYNPLRGEPARQ